MAHRRGVVAVAHGLRLAVQFPGVRHAELSVAPGDEVAQAEEDTGLIGEGLATGMNGARAAARAAAREIYRQLE